MSYLSVLPGRSVVVTDIEAPYVPESDLEEYERLSRRGCQLFSIGMFLFFACQILEEELMLVSPLLFYAVFVATFVCIFRGFNMCAEGRFSLFQANSVEDDAQQTANDPNNPNSNTSTNDDVVHDLPQYSKDPDLASERVLIKSAKLPTYEEALQTVHVNPNSQEASLVPFQYGSPPDISVSPTSSSSTPSRWTSWFSRRPSPSSDLSPPSYDAIVVSAEDIEAGSVTIGIPVDSDADDSPTSPAKTWFSSWFRRPSTSSSTSTFPSKNDPESPDALTSSRPVEQVTAQVLNEDQFVSTENLSSPLSPLPITDSDIVIDTDHQQSSV